TTSLKNLRLLNSRQAIEDIATFIDKMNKKYKLESPKWIVFGGSYAGQYNPNTVSETSTTKCEESAI
ncbi:hypothetical protein TELCIR_24550, partial [Teladorsagia circumcincta]